MKIIYVLHTLPLQKIRKRVILEIFLFDPHNDCRGYSIAMKPQIKYTSFTRLKRIY